MYGEINRGNYVYKSISRILILYVSFVIIIAIAGLVLYVESSSKNMVLTQQKESLLEAAHSVDKALDEYLLGCEDLLFSLSQQTATTKSLSGEKKVLAFTTNKAIGWIIIIFSSDIAGMISDISSGVSTLSSSSVNLSGVSSDLIAAATEEMSATIESIVQEPEHPGKSTAAVLRYRPALRNSPGWQGS